MTPSPPPGAPRGPIYMRSLACSNSLQQQSAATVSQQARPPLRPLDGTRTPHMPTMPTVFIDDPGDYCGGTSPEAKGMETLESWGHDSHAAYSNSSSEACVYAAVGTPKERCCSHSP